MKPVAKYNTCKGISTVLTLGTPITTLAICGAEIITPAGKISFAGVMVILITLLFAKDKLAENFKVPSVGFCLLDKKISSIKEWAYSLPAEKICGILKYN